MEGDFVHLLAVDTSEYPSSGVFLDVHETLPADGTKTFTAGTHDLPFSVPLPKTIVSNSAKAEGEVFELPPTITAAGLPTWIMYEIVITVKTSMFHSNDV